MDLRGRKRYALDMTRSDPREVVVVHHHLFKNAGTSFDVLLKENFGKAWEHREFGPRSEKEFRTWVEDAHHASAFSSHTAPIVPLAIPGVTALQCVFVRHPIDRIKSAYVFESKQDADTEGARLARSLTFAEYVRHRMDLPSDSQCRNFHVTRLAAFVPVGPGCASPLERAKAAIERLTFVGIVEEFDESLRRFDDLVRPFVPSFKLVRAHANASRAFGESLPTALRAIREELGQETFQRLVAANLDDLHLYAFARRKFVEATLDVLE